MKMIRQWTTRFALLTFSLLLMNACSSNGQESAVLDTPEWTQFRTLAEQYDSTITAFEKREKEDPAFAADPMGTAGADIQKFYALMQKIGENIPPTLGEVKNFEGMSMDDLRMVKLAAMMGEKVEIIPALDKELLKLVQDTDSLDALKMEIAQVSLMNGDIEEAKRYSTDDVLASADPMNRGMLYSSFSTALLDAKQNDEARTYAMKAVKEYGAAAADPNADPRQAQFIMGRYGLVIAPLMYEFKEAGDAAGMDALLADTKAQLPESVQWSDVQASINTAVAEIEKERAPLNKPATEWAEHEWLGSEALSLKSLKGKVILVDFFATWCKPCIRAFEHIREWEKTYKEDGLVVVGLTTYQSRYEGQSVTPEEELKKLTDDFIPKHDITWAVGVEKDGRKTMTDYGVSGIPQIVLIDREGKVQYVKVGAADYDKTEKKIQQLLAE